MRDQIGNFFVTKPAESTIEKITAGVVIVFAGTGAVGSNDGPAGSSTFNNPGGIAIDGEQNLYVVSIADNLVRKISKAGLVTTIAGQTTAGSIDGIGTAASFKAPNGIAFSNGGNGYIADEGNNTIRRVSLNGYEINKALPAGLIFDSTTGIITGTPTVVFPVTTYTITAHNYYGSSTFIVNIRVLVSTTLTFNPLLAETTCDADFDPNALSTNPITYTSSNSAVATIMNGKIHITGTGITTITASDRSASISQFLTVTYVAQPTITIAASASNVCAGKDINFIANVSNAGSNPVFQWLVNGSPKGSNSPFFSGVFNNGDQVTCTLKPNTACNTAIISNVISLQINTIPTVTFTTFNLGIKQGNTIQLMAITTGDIATYTWSPALGLDNSSTDKPYASPTVKTTYTLLVTTFAGCTAQASVIVDVINNIDIINTFTPNNDGVNDTWRIPSLAYFPGCTVKVYNRYGNLVFNSVNYSVAWDGSYNNSALPDGTYYYIIDPKNGKSVIAGRVTIIR